jgi:hypothetical protein
MQQWEAQVHRFIGKPITYVLYGVWLILRPVLLGMAAVYRGMKRWRGRWRAPSMIQIRSR